MAIASYGSAESRSYTHSASRNGRRDQQQDDEHVPELREELSPRGDRTFGGQLIRTVSLEPRPRLDRTEAAHGVAPERAHYLLDGPLILGGHLNSIYYHGVFGDAHETA